MAQTLQLADRLVNIPLALSDPNAQRWTGVDWKKCPRTWTGEPAHWSADPENDLGTIRQVVSAVYSHVGCYWDALGYLLRAGENLAFIDLDDCRDPLTGEVDASALSVGDGNTVLDILADTYWEVSASGTGLHGLVRVVPTGVVPGEALPACSNWVLPGGGKLELWTRDRLASLTLRRLDLEPCDLGTLDPKSWPLSQAAPEPAWLHAELRKVLRASRREKSLRIDSVARDGDLDLDASAGRNNTLSRYGWGLLHRGKVRTFEHLEHELRDANDRFAEPLPDREVESVAKSAFRGFERKGGDRTALYRSTATSGSPGDAPGGGDLDGSEPASGRTQMSQKIYSKTRRDRNPRAPRKISPKKLRGMGFEANPIKNHMKARDGHCPRRTCAPTIWGCVGSVIMASRGFCGCWRCQVCAPLRLAAWRQSLLESMDGRDVWYQVITEDEYRHLGPAARKRIERRNQAEPDVRPDQPRRHLYRGWRTSRGVEILSTEPFAGKAIPVAPDERSQVILAILCEIRETRKSREKLVFGSIEWSCPEIGTDPDEDYEYLGIGPLPDDASRELERQGLEHELSEPEYEEPITTGRRSRVLFHWELTADCGTRDHVDVVAESLGIKSRRREEPVYASDQRGEILRI